MIHTFHRRAATVAAATLGLAFGTIAIAVPASAAGSANLLLGDPAGPMEVDAGQTAEYFVSVLNRGPDATTPSVVYEATGEFTEFRPVSSYCANVDADTISCTSEQPLLPEEPGDLYRVEAVAGASGSITVTATASPAPADVDPDPTDNSGSATTTINEAPSADLGLDLEQQTSGEIMAGDDVQYLAFVKNPGPDVADAGVRFAVSGPVGAISGITGAGTCAPSSATVLVCDSQTINVDAPENVFGLQVTSNGGGAITVTAELIDASLSDPDADDNSETVQTTVTADPEADLAVALDAAPGPLLSSRIDYELTVSNDGPDDTTSGTVVVSLPSQVNAVPSGSHGCSFSNSTDQLTCPTGPIANGSQVVLSFRAQLGLLSIGSLPATAVRTASSPSDPNPANDSSSATCSVLTGLIMTC